MKGHAVHRTPFHYDWYARLDSNQRLSAPEADALSPELRALFNVLDSKLNIGYKLESISKIVDHVQEQGVSRCRSAVPPQAG